MKAAVKLSGPFGNMIPREACASKGGGRAGAQDGVGVKGGRFLRTSADRPALCLMKKVQEQAVVRKKALRQSPANPLPAVNNGISFVTPDPEEPTFYCLLWEPHVGQQKHIILYACD